MGKKGRSDVAYRGPNRFAGSAQNRACHLRADQGPHTTHQINRIPHTHKEDDLCVCGLVRFGMVLGSFRNKKAGAFAGLWRRAKGAAWAGFFYGAIHHLRLHKKKDESAVVGCPSGLPLRLITLVLFCLFQFRLLDPAGELLDPAGVLP